MHYNSIFWAKLHSWIHGHNKCSLTCLSKKSMILPWTFAIHAGVVLAHKNILCNPDWEKFLYSFLIRTPFITTCPCCSIYSSFLRHHSSPSLLSPYLSRIPQTPFITTSSLSLFITHSSDTIYHHLFSLSIYHPVITHHSSPPLLSPYLSPIPQTPFITISSLSLFITHSSDTIHHHLFFLPIYHPFTRHHSSPSLLCSYLSLIPQTLFITTCLCYSIYLAQWWPFPGPQVRWMAVKGWNWTSLAQVFLWVSWEAATHNEWRWLTRRSEVTLRTWRWFTRRSEVTLKVWQWLTRRSGSDAPRVTLTYMLLWRWPMTLETDLHATLEVTHNGIQWLTCCSRSDTWRTALTYNALALTHWRITDIHFALVQSKMGIILILKIKS